MFIRGDEYKDTFLNIVRIEKLKPCRNSIVNYTVDGNTTGKYFVFYLKDVLDGTTTNSQAISGDSNVVDIANYATPILRKLKEDNDLEYDIKLANFSKRSNGDVVITDPFWYGYYTPVFTMPGMMDNLDLVATGQQAPTSKRKLIVGKDGKSYTGDNKQALSTVAITWESYIKSNCTQDLMRIINSSDSYTKSKEFAKSMMKYSQREDITVDINQPKFISFQQFIIAVFQKHPLQFLEIIKAYAGPFPIVLLTINLNELPPDRISDLLDSIPYLRKSIALDHLMINLDNYVATQLSGRKKSEIRTRIVQVLSNTKLWKKFPSNLKINDPTTFT